MKIFTIEKETNNITIHATTQDAEAVANAEHFRNEGGLAKVAANWPTARLVDIWNSLPGATRVKKFKDRATAVSRIWKAIQNLGGAEREIAPAIESSTKGEVHDAGETTLAKPTTEALVTEQTISTLPEVGVARSVAPQIAHVAPKRAPAKKKATRAKKTPVAAAEKKTREGSKTEAVLELMKQPGGTTLKAIMEATNWQAHSVRGFISGTLGKKMGLTVVSAKAENGDRSYSISA